jgi:hypothetical protein
MSEQPSTSLRVRFITALGWKKCNTCSCGLWYNGSSVMTEFHNLPDPTDSNTVREAIMGMTEEEWEKFVALVGKAVGVYKDSHEMIFQTLRCPTTTLAKLYCDMKGAPRPISNRSEIWRRRAPRRLRI